MLPRQTIGRLQAAAARHRWSLRLAILLRNQCQCVIRHAFNDSNDIAGDGESAIIAAVAPRAAVVVDVGANVGDWTAEVLSKAPSCRALLFDPSQQAVDALRQRFATNSNVRVVAKGVSDRSGQLVFFEEPDAGKTSSFAPGFSVGGAQQRNVEVVTLDEEMNRRGIAHVDLLKVDAEGFDMHVIRGASVLLRAQQIGVIQFEYNAPWATTGSTLGEAVSTLTGFGYGLFALKSAGLFTFDYGRTGEFFGYANFVALSPALLPVLQHLVVGKIL